jgi:D-alanyl-D-alanine carboxypeptidase
MRFRTGLLAAVAAIALAPVGHAADAPAFVATVSPLTTAERAAMTPSVWRRGCPVPLSALRVVRVTHWNFKGQIRTGRLVVNRDAADDTVAIMRDLYAAKFPIRWMVPIERWKGSDFKSIEADNTSAFNCRYVDGTTRWSNHAYGRAIDINPIENPYVSGGRTSHPKSASYIKRSPRRTGMIVEGDAATKAIDAAGWDWGGRWRGTKDYQHISATGG